MSYVNEDVVEAARKSWNTLEGLFTQDPEFFEPNSTEFNAFYQNLLLHLMSEEREE